MYAFNVNEFLFLIKSSLDILILTYDILFTIILWDSICYKRELKFNIMMRYI